MMVKICGITNRDDALAAIDAGASALGFNFYPKSPRYVPPDAAAEILSGLPRGVWPVGVFVNELPEMIEQLARQLPLAVVQLHGDENAEDYIRFPRLWKAVRVGRTPVQGSGMAAVEAVLLDSGGNGTYGGSGQPFDWSLAAGIPVKTIVAGGLDADNVAEAIERARPWGVDACSRIEIEPGRKDRRKMARFIHAALAEI
jgi:phosphoribosylanthranilate isomerase